MSVMSVCYKCVLGKNTAFYHFKKQWYMELTKPTKGVFIMGKWLDRLKAKEIEAESKQLDIEYVIPEGLNFDFQVQAAIQAQYDNNIRWKKLVVYLKSRKIVLTGVTKPEFATLWHDTNKDSVYYKDCPWIGGN